MGPHVGWLPGEVVVAAVTFIMALPLETGALAARPVGPDLPGGGRRTQ